MKAIIITLVVGAALALAGCVSSDPVHLPNGQMGYTVHCNTGFHDMADCYDEAAKLCHGAYKVVSQSHHSQGFVTSASPGMVSGGSIPKRSIIVQCKAN